MSIIGGPRFDVRGPDIRHRAAEVRRPDPDREQTPRSEDRTPTANSPGRGPRTGPRGLRIGHRPADVRGPRGRRRSAGRGPRAGPRGRCPRTLKDRRPSVRHRTSNLGGSRFKVRTSRVRVRNSNLHFRTSKDLGLRPGPLTSMGRGSRSADRPPNRRASGLEIQELGPTPKRRTSDLQRKGIAVRGRGVNPPASQGRGSTSEVGASTPGRQGPAIPRTELEPRAAEDRGPGLEPRTSQH